jgi:hypothetical protein
MGFDWKPSAFISFGLAVGLMAGYFLNTELAAKSKASEICGVCQDNLNIMIGNFNNMTEQCSQPRYKDLPAFINNQTVRVYAS